MNSRIKTSSKKRANRKNPLKGFSRINKKLLIVMLLLVAVGAAFFIFRSRAASLDISVGKFYPIEDYFNVSYNNESASLNGGDGYQFRDIEPGNGIELVPATAAKERLTIWPGGSGAEVRFCARIENLSTDPARVDLMINLSNGYGKVNEKLTIEKITASKTGSKSKEYCASKSLASPEYLSEGSNAVYRINVVSGDVNITELKRLLISGVTSNKNLPVDVTTNPADGNKKKPQFAVFPVDGHREQILNDPRAENEQYKPYSTKSCSELHNGYCAADIYAETGTNIYSMTDGVVSDVKNNIDGSSSVGARIQIQDSATNNTYYYAHLKSGSVTKSIGDTVKAGDKIGVLGDDSEAQTTVRHLHIDITPGEGANYVERPNCDGPTCASIGFADVKAQLDQAWSNVPYMGKDDVAGVCEPPFESVLADNKMKEIYGSETYTSIMNKVDEFKPYYLEAQDATGVPWQALAVLHIHENNQSRINPDYGQGIYGFYTLTTEEGYTFPAGPITDANFQWQTNLAAEALKEKAAEASNNSGTLIHKAPLNVLYEAFFGYNGKSPSYLDQAEARGYNRATEGYHGSPYVANYLDNSRNPQINTTTWGQITGDGGSIGYPANDFAGSAIIYEALRGPYCSRDGKSISDEPNQDFYFLGDELLMPLRDEIEAGLKTSGEGSWDFGTTRTYEPGAYFNLQEGRSIAQSPGDSALDAVFQDRDIIAQSSIVFVSLGIHKNESDFLFEVEKLVEQILEFNPNTKIVWMDLVSAGPVVPYWENYYERNQILYDIDYTGGLNGNHIDMYPWHESMFKFDFRINVGTPMSLVYGYEPYRVIGDAARFASDGIHVNESNPSDEFHLSESIGRYLYDHYRREFNGNTGPITGGE